MIEQEINKAYARTIGSLDNKGLKSAFDSLQGLISGSGEFVFQEEIDELQNTYRNMLLYRAEGAKDPMQEQIYTHLQTSAYKLADRIKRKLLAKESMLMYYVNYRKEIYSRDDAYKYLHEQLITDKEVSNHAGFESGLNALFMKVWLSDFLNSDESDELRAMLSDEALSCPAGCQLVTALGLGLQEMFDEEKLMLLFDAASHVNSEVRIRAYICLLIVLYVYRKRIGLYASVYNRLALLAENKVFVKTVRTITLRFILARETEKITRRLQDEIIPEMMKLSPKLNKKVDLTDITPEQMGEGMNPEWQNLLDESGLSKKMEEFNELQMEGADVMHSTFIHLKNFSFFSEISNWFLPFTSDLPLLNSGTDNADQSLKVLEMAPFMCNSDKYSLYFSIMQMPKAHRDMMLGQFNSQMGEMAQQNKDELSGNIDNTEMMTGRYIQDLYRFYKLHPARRDFDDIFTLPLDFHNLPILRPYLSDEESLIAIAEYYLRKNYFDDALVIYGHLAEEQTSNAVLFQKTGYCKQMRGDISEALEDYLHADILSPDSPWLTRRIAACYRTLKQPREALRYYLRHESLQPENLSVLTSIGHCYLESKDYQEALKYYYKVDYLDNNNRKVWRPIAWSSFLIGKYDHARNYYGKILKDKPSAQDYLNAGHTEWALQNLKGALEYYKQAVVVESNKFHKFLEQFNQDRQDLLSAGIEESEIPLMIDQLLYSLDA